MLTTEMSPIVAAAQAGDTIVVRHAGGRPTTYKIRSVGGRKARELKLEGRRGSMRVLVDGGDQIWIREASARASDGSAHRRVMELCNTTTAINERRSPEQLRSTGMILRDMAIREAGLPPGYDIELHPRGFQAYSHTDGEPVGPTEASAYVAVCKCWQHHAGQAERAAQIAVLSRGVLPPGYDTISLGGDGRAPFVAVLDGPSQPVVSPCTRSHAVEAIVDAWSHAHEQLLGTLSKHRSTAIDRDVARGDASRCRRALQQILEIAEGNAPSGKELPSGKMPEQVAAEVGHALRVESRVGRVTRNVDVKLEQIEADPDRVFSSCISKMQAMADRRVQPYDKDATP